MEKCLLFNLNFGKTHFSQFLSNQLNAITFPSVDILSIKISFIASSNVASLSPFIIYFFCLFSLFFYQFHQYFYWCNRKSLKIVQCFSVKKCRSLRISNLNHNHIQWLNCTLAVAIHAFVCQLDLDQLLGDRLRTDQNCSRTKHNESNLRILQACKLPNDNFRFRNRFPFSFI